MKQQQPAFEIVTNNRGRRILVLNQIIHIDKEDRIQAEDFDAIFLNLEYFSRYEVAVALQRISPFASVKCWIKPRFYLNELDVQLSGLDYLVDGYGTSPFEPDIENRIEEIYQNIKRYNIRFQYKSLESHVILCLLLCKYVIVRGYYTFTTTIIPSLRKGYSSLFTSLFDNLRVNKRADMLLFMQKLIELKYVKKKRFIDRVHLCPKCHSSHLLFIECCPRCNSSELWEESVLHHFRCANISPESTYQYDGELRCPKCKQFLRHIGVDYDRPADVYTCRECSKTFLHPSMRVHCTECQHDFKTSELQPYDIEEYEFTTEGIEAIVSRQAAVIFSQNIWNGYSDFQLYLKQLQWFAVSDLMHDSIIVLRFRLIGNPLSEMDHLSLLQDIYVRFYYYNFTTDGAFYYLSNRCQEREIDQQIAQMENDIYANMNEFLHKYDDTVHCDDKQLFVYQKTDDIHAFISRITQLNK